MSRLKKELEHIDRFIAEHDLAPIITVRVSKHGKGKRVDFVVDGKTVASRPEEKVTDLQAYVLGFADGRGFGRLENDGDDYWSINSETEDEGADDD